jgi:hypothetical protein
MTRWVAKESGAIAATTAATCGVQSGARETGPRAGQAEDVRIVVELRRRS